MIQGLKDVRYMFLWLVSCMGTGGAIGDALECGTAPVASARKPRD